MLFKSPFSHRFLQGIKMRLFYGFHEISCLLGMHNQPQVFRIVEQMEYALIYCNFHGEKHKT